jgi:hypothetical protein
MRMIEKFASEGVACVRARMQLWSSLNFHSLSQVMN